MKSLVLVFAFWVPAAFAALGNDIATMEKDRATLNGQQTAVQANSSYSVYEMVSHGTTIRQYADSSGKVFAVTWKGIVEPDLSVLFGNYYAEYQQKMAARPRQPGNRRVVSLNTSAIAVNKWGHMRAQQGRAYVVSLLPSGVKAEELL
jgi:Protein of unknown function (DUF2844)